MSARRDCRAGALFALIWCAGRLPLPVLHGLGRLIGGVARRLGLREARVARRNLMLCRPETGAARLQALWRENLAQTGMTLTETLQFWTRPSGHNLRRIVHVEGGELLDAALAEGHGVIIAAPHLGNWELLNQWLASRSPLAIVYRPPRAEWMDAVIRRVRGQPGVTQVRAEASGVRTLFRHLKEGGMVGILPDQQPKRGDGEFAPFFGIPALTMTLLPRLAHRTGACVLMAYVVRGAHGFQVHVRPAPDAIGGADMGAATTAMNQAIEACIAQAPAQYQWSYKRFTIRPEGSPPIRYD